MLGSGHDDPPQSTLERELLGAARSNDSSDASKPDVQRAWQRFANRVGTLAATTEPTSGVHLLSRWTPPEPDPALPAPTLPTPPTPSPGRVTKALWAALGASLGSAVTATLFLVGSNEPAEPTLAEVTPPAAASGDSLDIELNRARPRPSDGASNSAGATTAATEVESAPSGTAVSDTAVSGTAVSGTVGTANAARRPPPQRAHSPKRPQLSIADEVRALDAARAACGRGEYERCFLVVERLHRDHPHSALRPDAEVLAVEALEALGRTRAAQRRASAFLARHPADPHAGRIRAVEQSTRSERD